MFEILGGKIDKELISWNGEFLFVGLSVKELEVEIKLMVVFVSKKFLCLNEDLSEVVELFIVYS